MSDSNEQFCWTSRWCRVMLLRRAIALSSGGDDDDIDPDAMPLLSWEKRRGTAHLHPTMWRTPDSVPLCTLCTVFFRNTSDAHCPVENTHCPRGASPGSADGGGRHQRGDRLYGVSKNSIYRWQERLSGVKKRCCCLL